jgi:hypothetical protein
VPDIFVRLFRSPSDGEQLWIGRVMFQERHDFKLSPTTPKVEMLFGRQILLAEEDHFAVKEQLVEKPEILVGQRLSQINAQYLGADCRRMVFQPQPVGGRK